MSTTLVTGAAGQIGSALAPALRDRYGTRAVLTSDVVESDGVSDPFETLDVTDYEALESVVDRHDVDRIFHLAAILSATGEQNPQRTYQVNVGGLYNVLEVGRKCDLERIVVPSSIAVFGPTTPPNPGEETILRPTTMYGVSKVITELMADYYYRRYDLDVRGIRFPGLLSHEAKPGGGTTDYAVEAFYEALERGSYTCFLREDSRLPMMYMPDAVNALIDLAEADDSDLRYRCEYNVGALDFTPVELAAEIQRHVPDFEMFYEPDERQKIADSWPDTVDDGAAREDWGWEPEYDLEEMTADMVENLAAKLE